MNRTNLQCLSRLLAALLLLGSTGCINTTVLPGYARSGDIVSIGLGGIKRNTDGTVLWAGPSANDPAPANITATITDAAAVTYNLKVIGMFRAFPDHVSYYAVNSLDRSGTQAIYGEMEPYDGQWWINLQLVDSSNVPLPLATGQATIAIQSAVLIDQQQTWEGQLENYQLTIVPGVRPYDETQNERYQYAAYKHRPVLMVKPSDTASVSEIGGLQLKINYKLSYLTAGTPLVPRLVPISHDPNINIVQRTVNNGDGTASLIAMVTNPNGFVALDGGNWAIGKSTLKDLNFAVFLEATNQALNNWNVNNNVVLDTSASFYVDGDGNSIVTVVPVLSRSY